ncbi:MAG: hypothetical protein H8D34_26475 [Chloroflexi bacterium]|nr:hypothetical protein [Chloroflexota bacterium]
MALAIFLVIHNLIRWIVLLLILYTLFRMYSGWIGKKSWSEADRKAGMLFTMGIDVQLLTGIILIFLRGFSAIQMRFWMEHIAMMVLAVVLGHVGSAVSKKAEADTEKFRKAAIWFTVTVLVILASIPWTRPLFRWF